MRYDQFRRSDRAAAYALAVVSDPNSDYSLTRELANCNVFLQFVNKKPIVTEIRLVIFRIIISNKYIVCDV